MAKDYLLKNAGLGEIPLVDKVTDFQATVLDSSKRTRQIEIDLYGTLGKDLLLVGECKFRNEKFDKSDFEVFLEKLDILSIENVAVCLFSLSGYTEYVINNSKNAILITLDDMYVAI